MITGLGGLVKELRKETSVPYEEIPGFPEFTVERHSGQLLLGSIEEARVALLQGRFHTDEGYSLQQATFPIRVLKGLGADTLVVSSLAGGMNPLWSIGEFMLIDDHINLLGDSPLVGPNDEFFGPRFPDMSEPYDIELQELAQASAIELGIQLHQGVYAAVKGPAFGTRAEYRVLKALGADVVGMSTVPEVLVARHMGMRVLGVSLISDECFSGSLRPVEVRKIISVAKAAEPEFTRLVKHILGRL